jgi:hypothetical protein
MSPRPKLYLTPEARKEAKRLVNLRYKSKIRERKRLLDELNGFGINNINLNNNNINAEEKLSKEERKSRYDDTVNKLTSVNTSNDIFNFCFKVEDRHKPAVQKKFGKTMDEFLKNLDYSDKYVVRYEFNDRWRSLPLDDKTGVMLHNQLQNEGFWIIRESIIQFNMKICMTSFQLQSLIL